MRVISERQSSVQIVARSPSLPKLSTNALSLAPSWRRLENGSVRGTGFQTEERAGRCLVT
jgi:hypothetical protein